MSVPVERNNSVFGDESVTASRAGRISTAPSTKSTFSITDCRMGSNLKFTFSKEKSLFIFSHTNPIRTFCVRFICNQWFDHFIITVILINCVLLAKNFENFKVEMLFAIIYTMEMIVKVIARGFTFHKHAYLRDPWNRLDFLVVMFGYLTLIEALSKLSFIKALRVLRSLKVITVVPGLRIMVNSLLKSLKNLSDVMLLTVFFLAVFAIIGLQLFMGNLRNRCVIDPSPDEHPYYYILRDDPEARGNWTDSDGVSLDIRTSLHEYINDEEHWIVLNGGEDDIICGNLGAPGTRQCPLGSYCHNTETNPNSGYTSFDNFGIAMLTCAQLITLDFWEDVYSKILGSSGAMYIVYFLCILLFGSFYLINLVLAVVAISYEQEVLGGNGDKDNASDRSSVEEEAEENKILEEDEGEDGKTNLTDGDNATQPPPIEKPTVRERITAMCTKCCCCTKCMKDEKPVIIEMGQPALTLEVDPERGTTEASVTASCQETYKDELMDIWTWFRSHTKSFIYCVWFENGIMLCIIVNTMCLAIDSPGLDQSVKDVLQIINDVLSWIFTTELAIKFVGLLPKEFWQTKWNIFDTIIVFISLVEMNLGSNANFNVSGLRSLRVLRVFRLAKSWSTMKALIDIIAESISGLVYLSVILGVVIYALSVIGMNLFENPYKEHYTGEENPMPRWHFLDFGHSFILLFRILCGEWIELLYETLDATKGNFWPVIFYIGALVMGNFLILNLFLALLLNAFGEESLNSKDEIEGDPPVPLSTRIKNKLLSSRRKKHKMASEIRMSSLALSADEQMKQNNPHNCPHKGKSNGNPDSDNAKPENDALSKHSEADDDDEFMPSKCYDCCQCCLMCCRPFCVCCSRFRASIRAVVEHNMFEYTILTLIMVSSLTLAFEDVSLDHAPIKRKVIDCLNNFYTVVFLMELILKMFAFGVGGYFSSAWHWLDSIVVAISIISLILANAGISGLKAIRALRALRPLRAISRWEGMRLSVNALIASIPSFGNVSLVCLVLWLVFCILAVQFFGDKFWKCIDEEDEKVDPSIVANKTQCISLYGEDAWQNSDINFDNTISAFIALYQVATFEGWMEVMDDAVDSTGVDQQPRFEASFIAYLFFLVFIFVGSFFTLNLLVGVIIDNFNRLKKEYEEKGQLGVLLTPGQRQWMSTFRKMTKTKPMRMVSPPKNPIMRYCYEVSDGQMFEILITVVILLNMVQMCMEHHNASPQFEQAMWWANLVFSIIYTIEAAIKLIGHRKFYFYKSWNIFDFVIVVAAWFGMIIDMIEMDSFIDPSILRCFRVFRVARILRIIQMAKGIRRLLYTLVCSLPALMNIGTLLMLIIYIYSVVGVAMFGTVQVQGILTDQQNFAATDTALIMMTRLATSAGWNDVLSSVMIAEPDCDPNLFDGDKPGTKGDCGFGVFGIAYFSSFVLVAFLVMINMYIAVILDNFSEAQQADEIGIDEDDINIFYEKWMLFDPKATQFLNVGRLRDLVMELQPPLGIPDVSEDDILHLDIPLYPTDRAHCIDVLQALISRTLGPENPNTSEEFDMIKELMAESFRSAFPTLAVEVIETTTKQRLREIRAAIVLQKALRRFKNYKKQAPPSP